MPFGDHVQTYRARISREDYGPGCKDFDAVRVEVPQTEPPPWWSEYLLEEWRRKYGVTLRDTRTQWQKADEAWRLLSHRWSPDDPHAPELPRHSIWE